jgi:hypothetical protein
MFRNRRLAQVALEFGDSNAVGECERRFEAALLDLERRYGRFSADALQRRQTRFSADALPSPSGPLFPPLGLSAMSSVQLRSSSYARWKWDGDMGEWIPDGMQRWNAWSAQQASGVSRMNVRATHYLNYSLQEKEVFESEAEKRFGYCRVKVVLLLLNSAVRTHRAPADLIKGKAE